MPRGRDRACGLVVALTALLLTASLSPPLAAAQNVPSGYDQGLFEIRLARLSAVTTTVLVSADGAVLLPVERVLEMTGLPVRRDTLDALIAIPRLGGPGESVLDARRLTMARGADTIRIAPSDLVVVGGETYLSGPRLADFLQAKVDVDFSLLRAIVSRSPPFPAEQAYATGYRRSTAGTGDATRVGQELAAPAYRGGNGGVVFDWALASSGRDATQSSSMELRSGVALAGGDLALGALLRQDAPGQRPVDGELSYRRVFPENRWIRQVQVGDLVGGAGLLRSLRGASITNAKLLRDQFFADVPVMPTLPQGWQYEVYMNGQLVGYSDATSAAPVYVPLRYGTTPVEVRMISPAGEEVSSDFLYQVAPTQLQPQRLEYSAGAGQCIGTDCRGLAYADFSYGAATWLTLESGAEVRFDSAGTSTRPQASASLATLDGWGAQIQAVAQSYSRVGLRYVGVAPLSLSLSAGTSQPDGGRPSFFVTRGSQWYGESQLALRIPAAASPLHALRLDNNGSGATDGSTSLWRSALAGDFGWGSLGVSWQANRTPGDEHFWGGSALLLAPRGVPRVFRGSALYAFTGVNGSGVRLADATLSIHAGRQGTIVVSGRWQPESGFQAGLGYATALGFGRLTTRLNHNEQRNRRDGTVSLTGSVAVDPAGNARTTWLDQGGVGSGGVEGRVFYDVDGDGHFGPGDQPAPNVPVLVAGHRVRADSNGFYQTWNVVPYEALRIAIDTLRSIDPSWTPGAIEHVIRATPHIYNTVDFPLVHTRELEGALVPDSGVAAPAGVTIVLTERRSGTSRRLLTYSDGGYYVSRLLPGDYDLTVAPSSLAALHAEAVPDRVRFTVASGDTDPVLDAPVIHLRLPYTPPQIVHVDVKKCPNPPAGVPLDSLGCPIIFREKRTVTLRGVNFELDRATLTSSSLDILAPIADALASDTSLRIEVAGHTDASGGRAHNLRLSQSRADSVRAFFVAHGVAPDRLVARGYGPDEPVGTNRTAAGRAANRRTELRRLDHPPTPDDFTVQVGRYASRVGAERLVTRLGTAGFEGRIVDQRGLFAVRVGRFATRAEASSLLRRLRAARFAGTVTLAERGAR